MITIPFISRDSKQVAQFFSVRSPSWIVHCFSIESIQTTAADLITNISTASLQDKLSSCVNTVIVPCALLSGWLLRKFSQWP